MKWLIVLIFSLTTGATANAQVIIALIFGSKLNSGKMAFGLVGGPVLTTISNLPQSEFKTGFDLALFFEYRLSDRFRIITELVGKGSFGTKGIKPYSTGDAGVDSLFDNGTVKRKLTTFGMVPGIRYRVAGTFFLEAGPQVNWTIKARDYFSTEEFGGNLQNEVDIKDQITTFDVGLYGGIVYKVSKIGGVGFGLRFYYGLTDIDKANPGTQCNRSILFHVYIPVGAAKSKKAQAESQPAAK